jgi:hypothetical protein
MHIEWYRRGRVGGSMDGLQRVLPEGCRPHAGYARSDGTQRVRQETGVTAPTPAALVKVTRELSGHLLGQRGCVSFV